MASPRFPFPGRPAAVDAGSLARLQVPSSFELDTDSPLYHRSCHGRLAHFPGTLLEQPYGNPKAEGRNQKEVRMTKSGKSSAHIYVIYIRISAFEFPMA